MRKWRWLYGLLLLAWAPLVWAAAQPKALFVDENDVAQFNRGALPIQAWHEHATDCVTNVTTASAGDQCRDLDDGRTWQCVTPTGGPSETLCDEADDWVGGFHTWLDTTGKLQPMRTGVPLILEPDEGQNVTIITGSGQATLNGFELLTSELTEQALFDTSDGRIGPLNIIKPSVLYGDTLEERAWEQGGSWFRRVYVTATGAIVPWAVDVPDGGVSCITGNELNIVCFEETTLKAHFTQISVGTLTGLLKGNGSSAVTAAVAGTDYTSPSSAEIFTNKNYNVEGAGNDFTTYDEVWSDAAGCVNATAGHVWDAPTTNAAEPVCEGSNIRKGVLAFDTATDESIHFKFRLPTGFTGAIDWIFRWKAVTITSPVGWCVQLVRVPVGGTSDPSLPAQGAGNCISDAAAGTTLQENEATISGVTCTSCVAGDMVYGRLSRDADGSAVTDTMAGDALLLGWTRRIRMVK